jgi:hypothetical protein
MGRPLGNFERLKLNQDSAIIGNSEWQPLLEQIDSFSYRGIAIRKEARRGGEFWYAFKKVNGRTRKIYCGKSWQFYGPQYFEGLYQRFEDLAK